jgi:hypothetical protein
MLCWVFGCFFLDKIFVVFLLFSYGGLLKRSEGILVDCYGLLWIVVFCLVVFFDAGFWTLMVLVSTKKEGYQVVLVNWG